MTRTAALGSIHPLIRKVTGDVSPYVKVTGDVSPYVKVTGDVSPYTKVTGDVSPYAKPPGLHTHHLHPFSTEVRNEWHQVSNPSTSYTDTNSPSPSLGTILPLQTQILL